MKKLITLLLIISGLLGTFSSYGMQKREASENSQKVKRIKIDSDPKTLEDIPSEIFGEIISSMGLDSVEMIKVLRSVSRDVRNKTMGPKVKMNFSGEQKKVAEKALVDNAKGSQLRAFLIASGIDASRALLYAVEKENVEVIQLLLKQGASPDKTCSIDTQIVSSLGLPTPVIKITSTPLAHAQYKGNPEIEKILRDAQSNE